jgi:methionyl-tRNA formyltransferase
MILVFCGTPRFAVPTLEKLTEAGHAVPLVVTQPDRPRGRGMEVAFSAVKESALRVGLPIAQPDKIKSNEEFRTQLEAIKPDAIIVVGYGRIVPPWMLDLPRFGTINLHASLLPKYRGAAPIQWAIAEGETVTGVTTMRIDAGLDTGDILLQREMPIGDEDTAVNLSPRLASVGAELMAETLRGLEASEVRPTPQDSSKATLAPILKKEDGRIDFELSATAIWNRLRGFQPWPGAYTSFRGRSFVMHSAHPAEGSRSLGLGELTGDGTRLLVGCGQKSILELTEVQLEGKRRMPARDFVNGYRPKPGEKLGS